MREECLRRHRTRVLIVEKLDGPRLDVMDVFSIASEGSLNALGEFDAMAYVDPRMGAMGEFAETVAVNRGMPVAFFNNVGQAERWLLEQKPGPGQQRGRLTYLSHAILLIQMNRWQISQPSPFSISARKLVP